MGGFGGHKTILSTCKDCTDRYPACHDKCEKYKEAKAKWTEQQQKIREEKQKVSAVHKYQVEAVLRMKHKK